MNDMQVEAVIAPAGITVEEGGGWKFVTLASPERAGLWLRRYCPCPAQSSTTRSPASMLDHWRGPQATGCRVEAKGEKCGQDYLAETGRRILGLAGDGTASLEENGGK